MGSAKAAKKKVGKYFPMLLEKNARRGVEGDCEECEGTGFDRLTLSVSSSLGSIDEALNTSVENLYRELEGDRLISNLWEMFSTLGWSDVKLSQPVVLYETDMRVPCWLVMHGCKFTGNKILFLEDANAWLSVREWEVVKELLEEACCLGLTVVSV